MREQKYGGHLTGLLVRRTYKELGDLIERSHELYGRAGWKFTGGDELCYRSPRGALLRYRHLDNIADARLYKGFNNQWLGADEIDEWGDPRPLDLLFATLRSKHGVPCVRRCTGNPGGPGHSWIKKRYKPHLLTPGGRAGYVRYQPQPEELPDLWVDAAFIPASMEDNPYLDHAQYEANLAIAATSRALFRAWRYGNWDVPAGQYFDSWDPALHVISRAAAAIEPWHPKWIAMDWGYTDDSAIGWFSINEERRIVTYQELVTNKKTADVLGKMIVDRCQIGVDENRKPVYDRYTDFFLGGDAFGEKTSERTIADEIGDVMVSYGLPRPTRAHDGPKTRIPGWQLMKQLYESGYWKITDECEDLAESIPLLMIDEDNPNDVAEHPRDHSPDMARYGLMTYQRKAKEPVENQIARRVTSTDPTMRVFQAMKAENDLIKKPRLRRLSKRRFF